MKHLRESIRILILENQANYDKLAKMICTQNVASITQALNLAETIGYVGLVEYHQEDWANGYGIEHYWNISGGYEQGLIDAIANLAASTPNFYLDLYFRFPTKDTMEWVFREET